MVKFYREFLGEVPTIRDAENPVPVIESSSTEMRCLSSFLLRVGMAQTPQEYELYIWSDSTYWH